MFGILILYIEVSNKHGPKQRLDPQQHYSSIVSDLLLLFCQQSTTTFLDFLLCRRPECHSGFSSSVCKVSVTHERTKLQCEQTVIRFESSGSAHRGRFKSASAHTFAGSALCYSVTLSLMRSRLCRPLSAHGGDDPAGSLQDSLGLQRGLHRRRPEPQHHQRGRQLCRG